MRLSVTDGVAVSSWIWPVKLPEYVCVCWFEHACAFPLGQVIPLSFTLPDKYEPGEVPANNAWHIIAPPARTYFGVQTGYELVTLLTVT